MSHFYGILEGQAKTKATRTGSKNSNMITICASWEGAIICVASYNKEHNIDIVQVFKTKWHGEGEYQLIYEGPIGKTTPKYKLNKITE